MLNIFLVIDKKENLVTNHFLSRYIVVYRRHNRDSLQFLSKRSALSAAKYICRSGRCEITAKKRSEFGK